MKRFIVDIGANAIHEAEVSEAARRAEML